MRMRRPGVTLIELLVVLSILAVLTVIAVPAFDHFFAADVPLPNQELAKQRSQVLRTARARPLSLIVGAETVRVYVDETGLTTADLRRTIRRTTGVLVDATDR